MDQVDVAIIGAGFGGIAAAHRLRGAGFTDIAILERAPDVGGVWRENTYPGCACDVPSHLYSLSFAPNPHWTRRYAPRAEIWDYLRGTVDGLGLRPLVRLRCEVADASWDPATATWRLSTSDGPLTARVLIGAQGALSEPSVPDVPGLADFTGTAFHTAEWRHDHDLTGERVAVVGTGASAIQVVPAIAPLVARLVVFQRTPPWVLPRGDRAFTDLERRLYAGFPPAEKLARLATYASLEPRAAAFVGAPRLAAVPEAATRRTMRRHIADPELRRRLTPTYRLGCKRALISDDWYASLARDNVDVVSAGVAEARGNTLVATDGSEHEVDTVILATGFRLFDAASWRTVRGADGRSISEVFDGSPRAYKGTTLPGFPNYFQVLGPNTGLGHTSMIYMMESQVAYVVDALRGMRARGVRAVDVRPEAVVAWNADVDRRLRRSVWASGGCHSWYQDASGRVTGNWPGFTFEFRRATRRFDPEAYRAVAATTPY